MKTEIKAVETRKELKEFILLPWKIYKNDPYWVPPLIMDMKKILNKNKNPFFEHSDAELFLAVKNGEVVGRIAAILNNRHNDVHNEKVGFFGFFESIHDLDVSNNLLQAAISWTKNKGLTHLRGPMNPSTNDTCGFLSEGFDSSPVILMSYNPKYYLNLMEEFGMAKIKELYAYHFNAEQSMPDRFVAMTNKILQDPNIKIRNIRLKDFKNEVDMIKTIYNDAWQANWGFVPMTDAEFAHLAKDLKPIVEPEFVFIAEVNGEVAGFSLSVPDYNQILKDINGRLLPFGIFKLLLNKKKINQLRVITLGVRSKFQKKRGLAPAFYYKTYMTGKKKGYLAGEFSWILDDNVLMNRALEALGARLYKKYVIYEKPV